MAIQVRNIEGTSDNTCKCSSWLDHWKNYGGDSIPKYCSEEKCTSPPTLGSHVQKNSATDKSWYIIPLCATHNKKADTLSVVDSTKFVSANVSATCGKK
jgi:hypothetical protein